MAEKQLGMFGDIPEKINKIDIIWHVITPFLQQFTSESNARRIVGRCVKEKGRPAAILAYDAITRLEALPADPITYFIKLSHSGADNFDTRQPTKLSAAERAQQAINERRAQQANSVY